MLATLMIDPPPASRIAGIAACMPSSVPVALTASRRSHASRVSSTSGVTWMIPALLTRIARRPLDVRRALTARAAGDDGDPAGEPPGDGTGGAHRNALPPVAVIVSPV